MRVEIVVLFLNTMTTFGKISPRNRDNFEQQIPIQLSQETKTFSEIFSAFLKSTSNFEYFEKKEEPHSLSISEINDSERGSYLTF